MAAIRAAIAFRRNNLKSAAGAIGVVAIGVLATTIGNWVGQGPLALVGFLMEVIGFIMSSGALLRLAFAGEHPDSPDFKPGPYGLQWGAHEWRLLATGAITIAAVVSAFAVPTAVGMGFGWVVGGGQMSFSGVGGFLGAIVGVCAGFYIGVRLSLSQPATVASQRIDLAWELTKGSVWSIFLAVLLIGLMVGAILIVAGIPLALMVSAFSPKDPIVQGWHAQAVKNALNGLVGGYVQLPLLLGVEVHFYRDLKRPPIEPYWKA